MTGGRVLVYQRTPTWWCDVCDQPGDGEPHEPHTATCPRSSDGTDDCDCDFIVHPECCWTPECQP